LKDLKCRTPKYKTLKNSRSKVQNENEASKSRLNMSLKRVWESKLTSQVQKN